MTGDYRPARTIEPGWHVHLAAGTGGGWMPVLARIDTISATGQQRVWLLGQSQAANAGADDLVFSRTPDEAGAAAQNDRDPRE
ncbi:hypothetical protein [Nonomuraea cavernae]|uniref:Uncharacterized protein n=1 Tax=Nonomuraea cavernae TaxID=2045107 RepID=A0A917ZDD3_9ACTN|nr:hypothetical protein [Nonomuraea cavernae]MCA2190643.1 hypothetical protein [Nonomuraea cavernae]GGO81260.1 hypothetical protein GCM10012289_69820 [Nonomuraea cavernae]